jgi:predicted glycosyltransferase
MAKSQLMKAEVKTVSKTGSPRSNRKKIWIDLDNTPHVPFFMPIIKELEARGYQVTVTARDAFQVRDLADLHKLTYRSIGRHYGKNRFMKVSGLFFRAMQLAPFAFEEKPDLGLSHGSRSQMIACNFLRIPTILIADYEHAKTPPFMRPRWELAPAAIPDDALHCQNGHVRKYSGIKEDVYAWMLTPDSSVLSDLSLSENEIIALVRPPATEAHYHNPESELLFERAMDRLCQTPNTRVVLLPRNHRQEDWVRSRWPRWFQSDRVVIPRKALDGLNLIWFSDLVISGGGTMNRESAALGVPVYSVFRGPIGAVDRQLEREGRLRLLASIDQVDSDVVIRKRPRKGLPSSKPGQALADIISHIESILELEGQQRRS